MSQEHYKRCIKKKLQTDQSKNISVNLKNKN